MLPSGQIGGALRIEGIGTCDAVAEKEFDRLDIIAA